jgi:hypothetical protein
MKRSLVQTTIRFAPVALLLAGSAFGADLNVPDKVTAGQPLTISGAPSGTMYLFGPDTAIKKNVGGGSVQIEGDQLKAAGRYTVTIEGNSKTFYVTNGEAENLAFLARPSRVPAAATGAVSGTAFVFDKYNNLVLQPTPVKFNLAVEGAAPVTRSATSSNGVAWVKLDSGRRAGAAQFVASAENASVKRVVQQVASDPCSIRMKAARGSNGDIVVETDPIRDCSGNAVPDGTIVTFTSIDSNGRSTIDARIKKGIAKAEFPASNNAQLSVAAGVVMGNEIQWGGGR